MATTVTTHAGSVKIRHPLAPLGLSLITLGIYGLYWYYAINAEMRDQGEDVSPGVALLAITLGAFLIIPPFVSLYNTGERIRRVQQRHGVTSQIIPVLALIMVFIPLVNMFQTAYLQSALNAAWENARNGAAGALGAPGQALPGTAPTATPELGQV